MCNFPSATWYGRNSTGFAQSCHSSQCAVSVTHIACAATVRESGAPKGSVYHFFPDGKQQIVSEALRRYSEQVTTAMTGSHQSRSFAGLLVTAMEGAYIRGRADRSGDAFREAGAWLSRLVEPPDSRFRRR